LEQWLYLVRNEIRINRGKMALLFGVISLTFLVAGLYWPKKYEASTTILASEQKIIAPLMEGTAVATGVQSLAGNAIETAAEEVSKRTRVENVGVGLLRISYIDPDPKRAFKTAQRFAALFIEESLKAKRNESREAFEFVDSQVKLYHKKLLDAETRLKEFRGKNADARPGSQADVEARIAQLRQQLEQTRLQLSEAREREKALVKQMTGEAAFSERLTKERGLF